MNAILLSLLPLCIAAQESTTPIAYESMEVVAAAGDAFRARLGRISVPADHRMPAGAQFELAFAHYPSTNPKPGPPIYFLVGGPGASGTQYGLEFTTQGLFDLRQHGEVIVLDQRGTGLSVPNLADGPEQAWALPDDRPSTRSALAAAHAAAAALCAQERVKEGFAAECFTTVQSADDIETLRRALGHGRIVLYGVSYGTHLGIEYLRRHGAHVERALLSRIEGPDHTYKRPSAGLAVLARLGERVAADEAYAERLPDFLGSLRELAARLDREPAVAVLRGPGSGPREIVLGSHDLALVIADALGQSRGQAFLPALVDGAARGDYAALGHFAARLREGSVGNAMGLWMDAASSGSPERMAQIEREAEEAGPFLGDALNAPYLREATAALGATDVGEELRRPFRCQVPVLFLSGELDARTPPGNAEELLPLFPRAAHLVFTHTAHDARELEFEHAVAPLHAFLRGEPLASATIDLPPLPLVAPR